MFDCAADVLHNSIMDNIKDYPGNVLAITDEQVAKDWRLGFGRAVAMAVMDGYPALKISERMGRFGANLEGGLNEHIEGARRPILDADGITTGYNREPACPIVEIYNLSESSSTHYEFSTYGDDGGSPVTLISALVSCSCGKIVKQEAAAEIRAGEFIAAVTNAGRR
jgi:hypothetical protein